MNTPILSLEVERIKVRELLHKRIDEYQQDLCNEGLTPQQYNILRGRIKELQDLFNALTLN